MSLMCCLLGQDSVPPTTYSKGMGRLDGTFCTAGPSYQWVRSQSVNNLLFKRRVFPKVKGTS